MRNHNRFSDGSIHLTWQLTPMSVHHKWDVGRRNKETQMWTTHQKMEKEKICSLDKIYLYRKVHLMQEGKKRVSILDWDVNFKFCLKLLLSSTCVISNTPLHHRLSADGSIHLTWQLTSENCFGVMMGQSQTERKIETQKDRKKRQKTWLRNTEFIALQYTSALMMMMMMMKLEYLIVT